MHSGPARSDEGYYTDSDTLYTIHMNPLAGRPVCIAKATRSHPIAGPVGNTRAIALALNVHTPGIPHGTVTSIALINSTTKTASTATTQTTTGP